MENAIIITNHEDSIEILENNLLKPITLNYNSHKTASIPNISEFYTDSLLSPSKNSNSSRSISPKKRKARKRFNENIDPTNDKVEFDTF